VADDRILLVLREDAFFPWFGAQEGYDVSTALLETKLWSEGDDGTR
jgi:hypothetical protein